MDLKLSRQMTALVVPVHQSVSCNAYCMYTAIGRSEEYILHSIKIPQRYAVEAICVCGIALNPSVDGLAAEEVSSQRKAGRRCFNGGLCTLPPEHHPNRKEHHCSKPYKFWEQTPLMLTNEPYHNCHIRSLQK